MCIYIYVYVWVSSSSPTCNAWEFMLDSSDWTWRREIDGEVFVGIVVVLFFFSWSKKGSWIQCTLLNRFFFSKRNYERLLWTLWRHFFFFCEEEKECRDGYIECRDAFQRQLIFFLSFFFFLIWLVCSIYTRLRRNMKEKNIRGL